MVEEKITLGLDKSIALYREPCFSTIESLFKGPKIQTNNHYYRVVKLFLSFKQYFESKFNIQATLVKNENPFFFFDTKKGKISIRLVLKLSSEEAFLVKVNSTSQLSYKTSKELVEDIKNHI